MGLFITKNKHSKAKNNYRSDYYPQWFSIFFSASNLVQLYQIKIFYCFSNNKNLNITSACHETVTWVVLDKPIYKAKQQVGKTKRKITQ